jgi:hypothetical protein
MWLSLGVGIGSRKNVSGTNLTTFQSSLNAHRHLDEAAKAAPDKAEAPEPTYAGLVLALGIKRYTLSLKTPCLGPLLIRRQFYRYVDFAQCT